MSPLVQCPKYLVESITALVLPQSFEEYCLVRLSVVYRGQALPIIWRVLKHDSVSVAFEAYRDILCQVVQRLAAGVKVVLLADRGFVHLKTMKLITITLGWHYRIQIKRNTWV